MSLPTQPILSAFAAHLRGAGFRLARFFQACAVRRPLPAYVRCRPLPDPRRLQLR